MYLILFIITIVIIIIIIITIIAIIFYMYLFNLYLNLLIYLCTWSYLLLLLLLSLLFLTLTLIRHIDWYELELVLCIYYFDFFSMILSTRKKAFQSNPIQCNFKPHLNFIFGILHCKLITETKVFYILLLTFFSFVVLVD